MTAYKYAVEVTDLHKSFGDVKAVNGVSFNVPYGSILGLLGPNGAGKTTTVRILTTILQADSGQAVIRGLDVSEYPDHVRQGIGLAGQYAAVDDNLNGYENLRMVSRLNHMSKKDSKARAWELLESFDLTDAANRPVKTYSGGMRRRLDLAAALVHKPMVLFLDEPTTGLDPKSRLALWGIIEDLVAHGTTVVLTTQYLEEADRLADNLVIINKGIVVATGTPKEMKEAYGKNTLDEIFLFLTDKEENDE